MTLKSGVLLHVGLHKCASTWLQNNILCREDYGFHSPWGEMAHMAVTEFVDVDPLCFDADSTRKKFDEVLEMQNGQGRIMAVSHEALSSRPHHGKYYAPHVASRLKAVFPQAKVLMIFREQSKIIYSLYGEYVRNGGQNSFAEFIGTGSEPPGWAPLIKFSFFEYHRLLCMYQEMFGTQNVLALPLEMLKSHSDEFTRHLFSFLGLPEQVSENEVTANKGWGALTVELYRMTNGIVRKNPLGGEASRIYNVRQFIAWRLDRVIPTRWNTSMEKKRRDLLARRIEGKFSDSNAKLSEMTGMDLKALGYR